MGQRHEHVVVQAALPQPPLGVDGLDRPEQQQRLVDQVAAEVEQRAAARGRGPRLGVEPLEPRLEPEDGAQCPPSDQRLDGAEVGVPAPVLVRRQGQPEPLRPLHRAPGGGRVEGEGLVADDRQAEVERAVGQLRVRGGGSGDRDGLGAGRHQILQRAEERGVRVLPGDERATLLRRRHHAEEGALGCRREQRRVEPPPAEAVPHQAEPDRFHRCAPTS
jgi:hypothetical protein